MACASAIASYEGFQRGRLMRRAELRFSFLDHDNVIAVRCLHGLPRVAVDGELEGSLRKGSGELLSSLPAEIAALLLEGS